MISAFSQFIEKRNLCSPNDRILVAVSGGIDSVVLLDLFYKTGYDFAIAHCNFKLRGEASDLDENMVIELAEKYHVQYFTKSFETETYAVDHKLSIQEAARNLRYDWFNKLAIEKGFDRIAAGHHLDDQVETFFINIFRGAGVKGLKGMPVKRGKIIRPLLFARRDEVEKYTGENNLSYREDTSNSSDKYLRNRIRHHLLPVISELKPKYSEALLKSLSFLEEENEVLNDLLNQKREELFLTDELGLKAKLSVIEKLSAAMFYALFAQFGFSRKVTDAILKSLKDKIPGKTFYSPTHRLLIDREYIFLREQSKSYPEKEYLIGHCTAEIPEPIPLLFRKIENKASCQMIKTPAYAYFDIDKLTFPLTLRKWKIGDRFVPFGMKGSKLVSDFLIDAKISRFEKEDIWVLLSDEKIIWVVGHRASEKFKTMSSTKTIFEVCLKR